MVEDVDEALGGQVDIEGEVDEGWVHDDGEAAFALFDNCLGEDGLVVTDRGMVTVGEKRLEVAFGCIAVCGSSGGEDEVEVVPGVGVNNWT